jgi:HEAT repeat protein
MTEDDWGKAGLDELVRAALKALDPGARRELESRGSAAVPVLVRALADRGCEGRHWAASLLGDLGDPAAVQPLIEALDDEAEVARWAANALGKLNDARAVEPLIRALRHGEQGVREYAATALGCLGDRRATGPLSEALVQDASWYVRCQMAHALGRLKDAAAVPALVEIFERDGENWEFVAGSAASALQEIGAPAPLRALVRALGRTLNAYHRESIVGALAQLARHDSGALLEGLPSTDALIRQGCVEGLREVGDEGAADALLRLLDDPVRPVRDAARATLKAWRRRGLRVTLPSRSPGEAFGDAVRWLMEDYFVVPDTGGFSAYRTGWLVHVIFSVLVGAAGVLIARHFLGISLPVLAVAAFAPVFLSWGIGIRAGVLSHYNLLITLGAAAVAVGAAVLIGKDFTVLAVAGVAAHGVASVLIRIMGFFYRLVTR